MLGPQDAQIAVQDARIGDLQVKVQNGDAANARLSARLEQLVGAQQDAVSMHNSKMRAEQREIEANRLVSNLNAELESMRADQARPDSNRDSQEQAVRAAEGRAERAERDAARWQKELAEAKAQDVNQTNSWVCSQALLA